MFRKFSSSMSGSSSTAGSFPIRDMSDYASILVKLRQDSKLCERSLFSDCLDYLKRSGSECRLRDCFSDPYMDAIQKSRAMEAISHLGSTDSNTLYKAVLNLRDLLEKTSPHNSWVVPSPSSNLIDKHKIKGIDDRESQQSIDGAFLNLALNCADPSTSKSKITEAFKALKGLSSTHISSQGHVSKPPMVTKIGDNVWTAKQLVQASYLDVMYKTIKTQDHAAQDFTIINQYFGKFSGHWPADNSILDCISTTASQGDTQDLEQDLVALDILWKGVVHLATRRIHSSTLHTNMNTINDKFRS